MAGLLPNPIVCSINRAVGLAAVLGLAAVPALLIHDYLSAERAWQLYRMEAARIRICPDHSVAQLQFFNQLQGLIDQSRLDPKRNLTARDQQAIRDVGERFPSTGNLFRMAVMEARNGRPEAANNALQKLCSMSAPASCTTARRTWSEQSADDPYLRGVLLPIEPS